MFPQSYEFTQLSVSSESGHGTNCPDVVMRNGQNWTVCYHDSEIRPKLMDCDLGEGTYNNSGAYPLFYSGTTNVKTYKFMFTFDPPLNLSSFTLHYYCSPVLLFVVAHDLRTDQSSQRSIVCGTGHQMESFTESEIPNQKVTVTFRIPQVFGEGVGIFLSEVQFFSGADSGSYTSKLDSVLSGWLHISHPGTEAWGRSIFQHFSLIAHERQNVEAEDVRIDR